MPVGTPSGVAELNDGMRSIGGLVTGGVLVGVPVVGAGCTGMAPYIGGGGAGGTTGTAGDAL
jgi:hypothetical protein